MGMDISGITNTNTTSIVQNKNDVKNTDTSKVEEKVAENKSTEQGATYEKSDVKETGTYKINKMSKEDRAALVQQLKADMEQQKQQMLELVNKTLYCPNNSITSKTSSFASKYIVYYLDKILIWGCI